MPKKAVKMQNTMTTQEIKDLINEKIAGQGNQVDSGGALANILTGIIDNMNMRSMISIYLDSDAFEDGGVESHTLKDLADYLRITETELAAIDKYDYILFDSGVNNAMAALSYVAYDKQGRCAEVVFGFESSSLDEASIVRITIDYINNLYSVWAISL